MRLELCICLVVLLAPLMAFALKKASGDEIKTTQEQILTARRMDEQIGAAQEILINYLKTPNANPEVIRRYERAIQREKDKQDAAFTKAIHMTIRAYGLEPKYPSGTSVMPSTKGREISWLPVARDDLPHFIQDVKGSTTLHPQSRRIYYGKTTKDGVTYIDRTAFDRGVGWLAATLLHEQLHFEQFTTRGRGDSLSVAGREEEARRFGRSGKKDNKKDVEEFLIKYFLDPVKEAGYVEEAVTAYAEMEAVVKQEEKEGNTILGRIRRLLPTDEHDEIDYRLHTDEDLAELKRKSDRIGAEVDKELAAVRKKREKMEAERNEAERVRLEREADLAEKQRKTNEHMALIEKIRREQLENMPSLSLSPSDAPIRRQSEAVDAAKPPPDASETGQLLAGLAIKACNHPGGVIDEDLKSFRSWFNFTSHRLALASELGLTGCSHLLYNELRMLYEAVPKANVDAHGINRLAEDAKAQNSGAQPELEPPSNGGEPGRGYSGPCGDGGSDCGGRWRNRSR